MDQAEWTEKEGRIGALMRRHSLDALLLTRASNVAWLSGGTRPYINTATDGAVGSLLVTPSGRYLLTDVIEADRLRDEEGFGGGMWEIVAEPWHSPRQALAALTQGLRTGTDQPGTEMVDIGGEVARLRWTLTPAEAERFRQVGALAGEAIGEAASAVRPGMSEHEIAALLAEATYRRGALPIVVLIATDDRLLKRRHPLPTDRLMERSAMLVLCARQYGLVASVTRLVHFGPVPDEMRAAHLAAASIDTAVLQSTRPGAVAGEIFAVLQSAYERTGYAGEWQNHHQGGLAGYEPREYVATPGSTEVVEAVQAFAWNPSVPGAKSEDTFLLTQEGLELLTPSPGWPQVEVGIGGEKMQRPDILQM
jgi:Xaa-Pro aminopeptidase